MKILTIASLILTATLSYGQLPVIPTETITPGTFNRLWLKNLQFTPTRAVFTMLPYDGVGLLLQDPVSNKIVNLTNTVALSSIVSNTFEWAKSEIKTTNATVKIIMLYAPQPNKEARLNIMYGSNQIHSISNLFSYAATNVTLGTLMYQVVDWVSKNP